MNIEKEIEIAEQLTINNDDDLSRIKQKYFSKDGILPKIYKLASLERGSKSDAILKQLVKIRIIIDDKITKYLKSIT